MKKLLLALLINCATIAPTCANEVAVIGCRIMLDRKDYTIQDGKTYIHDVCFEEIFESFKAWEMLDFHVFIYVECERCGTAHPVDYECPNCKQRYS